MNEHEISCVYYPTTVVIIDDNKSFLQTVQLKIEKHIPCKTYSDPQEALIFLEGAIKKNNLLKDTIGIDESSEYYSHTSSKLPLRYSVSELFQRIYNEGRFAEVSVVVVDYAMPSMNGEEVCKKLRLDKKNRIKIIMLTGEAEEEIATRLFNAGVIDKFLRKAQLDTDELENNILAMQNRYFQELTYPVIQILSSDKDSSLGDPLFKEFFNKLRHEISACCYYLIDFSGSFLFMDKSGSPTFLIIKTLHELAGIADQMEDEDLPFELVESVRNGEFVPYFSSTQANIYKKKTFQKHLYRAKLFKGEKDYAYAILNELPSFPLERNKILSFNDYINNL